MPHAPERPEQAQSRIEQLERELQTIRGSARYLIGETIVETFSTSGILTMPRRLVRLGRELVRLRRRRGLAESLEWGAPDRLAEDLAKLDRKALESVKARLDCAAIERKSDVPPDTDLLRLASEMALATRTPSHLFPSERQPGPGRSGSLTRAVALMIVRNALPDKKNGYALRTQSIAAALSAEGWTVHVAVLDAPTGSSWSIGSVTYHGAAPAGEQVRGPKSYVDTRLIAVLEIARLTRPGWIHAASNYLCALVAAHLARATVLGWSYELRGLWHYTRASVSPAFAQGAGYRLQDALEKEAVRQADCVFANGQALKQWAIRQGASLVEDLPNGADVESEAPKPCDVAAVRRQWAADEEPVIGFLGSVTAYEGLEVLITASELVKKRGFPHRLVIIGGGDDLDRIKSRAGTADWVTFVPPLDAAETRVAAAAIDIHCVPRLDTPATRIVAPLKPTDAAAAGRPLVVSNLPALEPFMTEGAAMAARPGDARDLARVLALLLSDQERRRAMGHAARQYADRWSWRRIVRIMVQRWQERTSAISGINDRQG